MITTAFFIRFYIFLVAIFHQTNAKGNSSSNERNESGCEWNCTIVDWIFGKETKTLITEKRVVKLDVKFRLLVNKHCVNQTEVNTSTEQLYWWIWLTDNSEPSYANGFVTKTFSGVVWFSGSGNTGQRGMSQISCALKHPTKSALNRTQSLSLNNHIALLLKPEDVADSTGRLHSGILYNTETSPNDPKPKNLTESVGLTNVVLQIMMYPIYIIFIFYYPVIICLFSAIEVKEQGVRVMILEGPRIMSFRGWVVRFWSREDAMSLVRRRKCFYFLQLVFLPLIILSSFLLGITILPVPPYRKSIGIFNLTNLSLTFYGLFVIRSICVACIPALSLTRPCLICQFLGVEHIRGVDHVKEEIRQHLRIHPLIFMKFCLMFVRWLSCYANMFNVLTSPRVKYILVPIQVFLCILWLPTILPVMVILSAVCLFLATVVVFCSCPLLTLYDLVIYLYAIELDRLSLIPRVFLFFIISFYFPGLAVWIDSFVILSALVSLSIVRILVLNLNESLPYVAVSVLILYYLWSCYSSFTDKYQDLALKLYKHYKTTAVQLQSDKIMKIPKNLFDMACAELMPVRQSVCMLLVEIVSILMFVGIVFSIVMETTGVTPVTQAVVTFFSGSLPKLVAIFYGAGNKGNIEDAALDQKTRCIVQEYTTRSSSLNQANQNENFDATDEENAALINPTEIGYGTV